MSHARVRRGALAILSSFLLALAAAMSAPGAGIARALTLDPCVIAPASCSTLTVALSGYGRGTVYTTKTLNGGIDGLLECSIAAGAVDGACSHTYDVGTGKTLAVYVLVGPGTNDEACTGKLLLCSTSTFAATITLTAGIDRTYAVSFDPVNAVKVSVSLTGTGTAGSGIRSTPLGIRCPTTCMWEFPGGVAMSLTVSVGTGDVFRGWSVGPCQGQGVVCTFTPTTDATVSAAVEAPATPAPTSAGGGGGGPTAAPTAAPAPSPAVASGEPASAAPGDTAATVASEPAPSAGAGASAAPSSTGAASDAGGSSIPIALIAVVAVVAVGAGFLLGRRGPAKG